MSNRLVLVLVEGFSDRTALYYPLNQIFNSLYNGCYIVDFAWMNGRKANENGGDVTSEKSNTRGLFLENFINTFLIESFFNSTKHSWKTSDLAGIIHFNDTDGAFVPDEYVKEDKSIKKVMYSPNGIVTCNRFDLCERNHRKSANMRYLCEKQKFTVQGRKSVCVPFSYHYFSTSIDAVLYGKYNSTEEEKKTDSDALFRKSALGYSLEKAFSSDGELSSFVTNKMSYEESWEYIQKDNNSLSRMTNINTLFEKIYTGFFD